MTAGETGGNRRWWPRVRAGLWIVALPLLFTLGAAVMMLGRDISAPTWIRDRLEAQAAEVLGGGSLRFGEISLRVETDLHPRLRLTDVVLSDAEGRPLARLDRMVIQTSPRGLLFERRLLAQQISIDGAEIALTREADGGLALAFEMQAPALHGGGGIAEILAAVDRLLSRPALDALKWIRLDNLTGVYEDRRADRRWRIEAGALRLQRDGGGLGLAAELDLVSPSRRARISAGYDRPGSGPAARVQLAVEGIDAADLASQSPGLVWLGLIDAPITGTMQARLTGDGTAGPLSAVLELGAGSVGLGGDETSFESARSNLTYEPDRNRVRLDLFEARAAAGEVTGRGQLLLQGGAPRAWPNRIVAQLQLERLFLAAEHPGAGLRATGIDLEARLQLDPLVLDLGQVAGALDGVPFAASGRFRQETGGWNGALDVQVPRVSAGRVLTFWPDHQQPATRRWLRENLGAGQLSEVHLAWRRAPGSAAEMSAGFAFSQTDLRVQPGLPPVRDAAGWLDINEGRLALVVESGGIAVPEGRVDVSGSTLVIPDLTAEAPAARVSLSLDGPLEAYTGFLDLPPLAILSRAGLPGTPATGRARAEGALTVDLTGTRPLDYDISARISDLRSERLVAGRVLTAEALRLSANRTDLVISGRADLSGVAFDGRLDQPIGTGAFGQVSGIARLRAEDLAAFGIILPAGMVRGAGEAEVALALGPEPRLTLRSNLRGFGLGIPALGWTKPPEQSGLLEADIVLSQPARVPRLRLDAAGLSLAGEITLDALGVFQEANFRSVALGGWLSAPVRLVGRGPGAVPRIELDGGNIDLRHLARGAAGGGGGSADRTPLVARIDRLQLSDDIALTGLAGRFTLADGGIDGNFTASVNGLAPVRGTAVPLAGGTAVRLRSADAGAALGAARILDTLRGGDLDLTLLPAGPPGTYDGSLTIRDIRMRDAPVMAALLNAISVVGLLQQLDGNGLHFSEVDAAFQLSPDRITVTRGAAVGPSLGLSLDGIYDLDRETMAFQGVISPIYLINRVGSVLTRRGEGLIGFTFTLRGPAATPQVGVNPLSAFTPGMFREIFRRPPPQVR